MCRNGGAGPSVAKWRQSKVVYNIAWFWHSIMVLGRAGCCLGDVQHCIVAVRCSTVVCWQSDVLRCEVESKPCLAILHKIWIVVSCIDIVGLFNN